MMMVAFKFQLRWDLGELGYYGGGADDTDGGADDGGRDPALAFEVEVFTLPRVAFYTFLGGACTILFFIRLPNMCRQPEGSPC